MGVAHSRGLLFRPNDATTKLIFFLFPSDISMSYRASVVKVPDYSSSSFSTEGFSVYKNVQTG